MRWLVRWEDFVHGMADQNRSLELVLCDKVLDILRHHGIVVSQVVR